MDCLFCKIAQGEIKANIIYDDKNMVAFHDIHPQAPTHILIIPKKHITTINDVEHIDEQLLGQMILKARDIAKAQQLSESGYRLIFNVNAGGGQAVYHIHLHLLGGRQMMWPPG
ncbi:HIT family hydrolase [Legionella busanensis]|uniref:HIT family hydrolase n=1 Tax=Legionella busanensis TaxID=190655 RepID=A0A378JNB4_9GAMM|nr:histidine triad nucleotide-binding protein [Legionella busanensis]STX52745.1 HIT family hydrolase [Legionella busanensis]